MAALYNVLFLCTGNSGRGIMAEALLNHLGRGLFNGHSACSFPTGPVHPLALSLLEKSGVPAKDLRSKSWNEFIAPGASPMDFAFGICDRAAAEACPIWPGRPPPAPWDIPDPSSVEGSELVRTLAFRKSCQMLTTRIKLFLILRSPELIAWL